MYSTIVYIARLGEKRGELTLRTNRNIFLTLTITYTMEIFRSTLYFKSCSFKIGLYLFSAQINKV